MERVELQKRRCESTGNELLSGEQRLLVHNKNIPASPTIPSE